MAGSYGHVVDEQGRLLQPKDICGMLECSSGDVPEAVEEMYGMIWWLADRLVENIDGSPDNPDTEGMDIISAKGLVERARDRYREGLRLSPGRRPKGEPLEDEE